MPTAPRIPLYYTFGNHMHWVDFEWLWGYFAMPATVRDMIHFCNETGAKGNVNFDGIGYEKLAVDAPDALAELKEAVQSGMLEIVGASYGQPYGLFHGGESNVRQRVYGVRAVIRILGVRPRTFWEEEFDFFPQLPQMLTGVGLQNASLFFQWTWHTPEVPKEDVPVVWWEGQDGSRLLTATRNKLNLHQWPEDMDILLNQMVEEAATGQTTTHAPQTTTPLILQWLELMPTPDWMCRSELLLPKLKEILGDKRFDVQHATLGEYLEGVRNSGSAVENPGLNTQHSTLNTPIPVRPYSMNDVWHGMTLGKNGDNMRRLSGHAERTLLAAETLAAVAGMFGRPYAQWDVYPTWELEEAWRELLQAQHHDNDECEALCGYVGRMSYERSIQLSSRIGRVTMRTLADHAGAEHHRVSWFGTFANDFQDAARDALPVLSSDEDTGLPRRTLLFNPLGWERPAQIRRGREWSKTNTVSVPAFGFVTVEMPPDKDKSGPDRPAIIEREGLRCQRDEEKGYIRQISSPEFPEGSLRDAGAFGFWLTRDGQRIDVKPPRLVKNEVTGRLKKVKAGKDDLHFHAALSAFRAAVDVHVSGNILRPDPGLNAAFQTAFRPNFRARLIADQPYGVSEIVPIEKGLKKYPSGDWMTSPQWFEEVHRPFTASTFVDLTDADNPDRGLLIVHDGSQQWFLDEDGSVRCLLSAYDPWDEKYFRGAIDARFQLIPHGPITNAERYRIAQEFLRPAVRENFDSKEVLLSGFEGPSYDAANACLTAFYRETPEVGLGLENYAGTAEGMDTHYLYVLRAVEFNGEPADGTLKVTGTVAAAYKTNLLGEILERLEVQTTPREGKLPQTKIPLKLRPFEISTVYLDIVEGRKQNRDLDAFRKVWATVHRVDE